jgi:hypothetical protein
MINDELKQYIIDYIDDIKKDLYFFEHQSELNNMRLKYIFKDISKDEVKADHDRLIKIRQICEAYTMMLHIHKSETTDDSMIY